jgi:ribose transport system permease protein
MTAQLASLGGFILRVPGVAIVLAVLSILFAFMSPSFATIPNLQNILTQSAILLLLALPMTLIIMTEGLDLSIGAVLTLASIILAATVITTGSPTLAFLAALALGLSFGIANGVLITLFELPPFIATLGTLGIAQGLALVFTEGQSIVGIPREIGQFYSGSFGGIPIPIILGALAYAVFYVILYRTRVGTYVFALGGNREALKLAGVSDSLMLVVIYALGGLMAGIGALLLTARMSAAHPTAGIGYEFDAIAAVAVGGTSFERGNGWLLGTLLGVLVIGVLRNGLNLLGVPSAMQVVGIGALVIVALLIDSLRSRV